MFAFILSVWISSYVENVYFFEAVAETKRYSHSHPLGPHQGKAYSGCQDQRFWEDKYSACVETVERGILKMYSSNVRVELFVKL